MAILSPKSSLLSPGGAQSFQDAYAAETDPALTVGGSSGEAIDLTEDAAADDGDLIASVYDSADSKWADIKAGGAVDMAVAGGNAQVSVVTLSGSRIIRIASTGPVPPDYASTALAIAAAQAASLTGWILVRVLGVLTWVLVP